MMTKFDRRDKFHNVDTGCKFVPLGACQMFGRLTRSLEIFDPELTH